MRYPVLRVLSLGSFHGYAIAQHLAAASGGVLQVEPGSLYPALERLLNKGWVTARWAESPTKRQARYYTITASGRKHLARNRSEYQLMTRSIARVLGNA